MDPDEFGLLLIALIGNRMDKFCSCLKNMIGGVICERVCSLGVVSNAIPTDCIICLCVFTLEDSLTKKRHNLEKVW